MDSSNKTNHRMRQKFSMSLKNTNPPIKKRFSEVEDYNFSEQEKGVKDSFGLSIQGEHFEAEVSQKIVADEEYNMYKEKYLQKHVSGKKGEKERQVKSKGKGIKKNLSVQKFEGMFSPKIQLYGKKKSSNFVKKKIYGETLQGTHLICDVHLIMVENWSHFLRIYKELSNHTNLILKN